MDNSVHLLETRELRAKTWKIVYQEETYIYTAYYDKADGRLYTETMRDEYGYDISERTAHIYDYWCSQDNSLEVSH